MTPQVGAKDIVNICLKTYVNVLHQGWLFLGRDEGLVPSNTNLMAPSNELKEVGVHMLNEYSQIKAFVVQNHPRHNIYLSIP